jgi:hypothetical protein
MARTCALSSGAPSRWCRARVMFAATIHHASSRVHTVLPLIGSANRSDPRDVDVGARRVGDEGEAHRDPRALPRLERRCAPGRGVLVCQMARPSAVAIHTRAGARRDRASG